MARSKRGLWFKFGRFITGFTIACFFLPFFGVSCQGMDVITVSGTDMVGGCRPGGLISDAQDQKEARGMSTKRHDDGEIKVDKVEREPLAIVALALALAVFAFSWVRTRGSMLAALALSIACLGALAGLYVKVGGKLKDAVDQELTRQNGETTRMTSKMMKEADVDAGAKYGLWITCLDLIGIAALAGLALREPEGTELLPPAPPPPAA